MSAASDPAQAAGACLADLLGLPLPAEGEAATFADWHYLMQGGILRAKAGLSPAQDQTRRSFAFLWSGTDRFASDADVAALGAWYRGMYGDPAEAPWWDDYGARPLLLDAGCGAGLSALGTFGERLKSVRYLGVDVSSAVEAARARLGAKGVDAAFLQADLMRLPLPDESADVIFSQGVLHHTDSTEAALRALAAKLRTGGRILFYVYRKKGPVREFTDDFIRAKLQALAPDDAWRAVMPLTKLGKALGDLHVEIDVPEAIELLGIPAGRIDVQRLFYWHFFKAFHHPDWSLDELNHINLDWYAPANAHRQTPEEVRSWCNALDLEVQREHLQDSGITIIAKKVAR